jgi:hypothetical protein
MLSERGKVSSLFMAGGILWPPGAALYALLIKILASARAAGGSREKEPRERRRGRKRLKRKTAQAGIGFREKGLKRKAA